MSDIDGDVRLLRAMAEAACDKYAKAPVVGPMYGGMILRVLERLDVLQRDVHILVQQRDNALSERDAAMALLRECREFIESAPMARDATRRKFPLCDRIDALLDDGGEGRRD